MRDLGLDLLLAGPRGLHPPALRPHIRPHRLLLPQLRRLDHGPGSAIGHDPRDVSDVGRHDWRTNGKRFQNGSTRTMTSRRHSVAGSTSGFSSNTISSLVFSRTSDARSRTLLGARLGAAAGGLYFASDLFGAFVAIGETIILMEGWRPGPTLNNGRTRWDATKLGQQLATDVFRTRTPGLRCIRRSAIGRMLRATRPDDVGTNLRPDTAAARRRGALCRNGKRRQCGGTQGEHEACELRDAPPPLQ